MSWTKRRGAFAALWALLALALFLSLRLGSRSYTLGELLTALKAGDVSDPVYRIARYVRLPRTLACLSAGAALAVAGVLTQSVLNNAMASPNILGVNAGAGLAALLAAAFLPAGTQPTAAFLGALATALLIYALARKAGMSRTTLILSGVAVSGILNAGINALRLLRPEAVAASGNFLLGSFAGVGLESVGRAAWFLLPGLILALLLSTELNVLQLGEESAHSLGMNVERTRFLAILAASLLAGAAVSFAGLIGFVGLLVPHMARRFVGTDARALLPAAALLGAAFVLLCDTLARVLFAPFELPVGILLSLMGGGFFLYLLLRHKRGRVYA